MKHFIMALMAAAVVSASVAANTADARPRGRVIIRGGSNPGIYYRGGRNYYRGYNRGYYPRYYNYGGYYRPYYNYNRGYYGYGYPYYGRGYGGSGFYFRF